MYRHLIDQKQCFDMVYRYGPSIVMHRLRPRGVPHGALFIVASIELPILVRLAGVPQ